MDIKRYRIVAVGARTPNVLSEISNKLSQQNYEIETISSLRLGHSIVVVCLIEAFHDKDAIQNCLKDIVEEFDLNLMIDECSREKFPFVKSDAFVRVRGNHVAGIKAYIISECINAGLDIHGLESDTFHKNGEDRFVINIKGQATNGIESLSMTADKLLKQDIDVAVANNWQLLA